MKPSTLVPVMLTVLFSACTSSNEVNLTKDDYGQGNVFGLYVGTVTYTNSLSLYFQDRGMKLCLYNPSTKSATLLIGKVSDGQVVYDLYRDVNYTTHTYAMLYENSAMPDDIENFATDEFALKDKGFTVSSTKILDKTCNLYSFSDGDKYRATFRGVTFGYRIGITGEDHITTEKWIEASAISYDSPDNSWFDTTALKKRE